MPALQLEPALLVLPGHQVSEETGDARRTIGDHVSGSLHPAFAFRRMTLLIDPLEMRLLQDCARLFDSHVGCLLLQGIAREVP
jgi:hypothetical protein